MGAEACGAFRGAPAAPRVLRLRRGGFTEVQLDQRSRRRLNIKADESGANTRFMPRASFRPELTAEACFGKPKTRRARAARAVSPPKGAPPSVLTPQQIIRNESIDKKTTNLVRVPPPPRVPRRRRGRPVALAAPAVLVPPADADRRPPRRRRPPPPRRRGRPRGRRLPRHRALCTHVVERAVVRRPEAAGAGGQVL